jgi:hypothetical protein
MTAQQILDPDAPVTRREVEALVEEKVTERVASGPGPKDYIYKGDPYWIAVRENVRRVLREVGAVCYNDIENDPWFQTELPKLDLTDHAGLDHPMKWDRCIKKLAQGSERADGDTSEIVFFDVPFKGACKMRFVALRGEVHCGVDRACRKVGLSHERKGAVVANVRRRWGVTGDACPRCVSVV